MKRSLLYHSIFKPDPQGHGGSRRTAQICQLLDKSGFEADFVSPQSGSTWKNLMAGVKFATQQSLWPDPFWRFGSFGFPATVYRQAFDQHSGQKLLIWEANRELFEIAPIVAKSAGYRVIALPHNIEALVSVPAERGGGPLDLRSLSHELYCLSQADAVFCISWEETWLLRQCGIPANFLPYYPPEDTVKSLENIRQLRVATEKNRFLIVGTVKNQPTLEGMLEQLNMLAKLRTQVPFEVDVAGYGSEVLAEHCNFEGLKLHGSVDQSFLDHLLTHAKAVLVHQKTGAGALTRIPEMLIAGIPVIANDQASRSAAYEGVYLYEGAEALADLLTKEFGHQPALSKPEQSEKRFIDCLEAMLDPPTERLG